MKRTRKWSFVAQEANRLAGLGLAPSQIAVRLNVNRSTVTRWIASGKLTVADVLPEGHPVVPPGQSAQQWAATVRNAYALDATDDQLVTLAEAALTTALDPMTSARVQLSAMGRFQALVKQLALVARATDDEEEAVPEPEPAPAEEVPPTPRREREDPRAHLMNPSGSTIQ